MKLTIREDELIVLKACNLPNRLSDLTATLGYRPSSDEPVPLQTWWDLESTSVRNMWWSLRALNDQEEARRIGVLASVRAIRRTLNPAQLKVCETLLSNVEDCFTKAVPPQHTITTLTKELLPLSTGYNRFHILIGSIRAAISQHVWHYHLEYIAATCIDINWDAGKNEEDSKYKSTRERLTQKHDLYELAKLELTGVTQ